MSTDTSDLSGGAGASTTSSSQVSPSFPVRLQRSLSLKFQSLIDASSPHYIVRWIFLLFLCLTYCIRVYVLQGFYIVTYGLGIFLLNLFIGFLTPVDDTDNDGPSLPITEYDEYKPFVRRLPEFKFWYSSSQAIVIALIMTFFAVFDVPVFWPILLIYFIVLFVLTMKRQIKHMIQYKYIPFSFGKRTYSKKKQQEDIRVK